jgi:hypothetical protein
MAIDNYKIFNGSEWITPCDCEAQILTPTGWTKLDPRNCPTSYWDGSQWCPIECFEPCTKCPTGYVINPATKTNCIKYTVPDYDGTMRVMSPGCNLQGTYGRYGLALFDEVDVSLGHYLVSPSPNGQIRLQNGTIVSQKPNILYTATPASLPATSLFKSNLWYYRLCAVGLMEYKYDVWNKKRAYALDTIVLYNDAGTWKKYKCTAAVSANITAPFNLNPKQATTRWSLVGNVNTIYNKLGDNTDINEQYSTFEFTVCLTLDTTKIYHLGFSADNKCSVDVQLNQTGPFQKIIEQSFDAGWAHWFVLPVKLPAGTHILKLKGTNDRDVGSIGLEIYDFNKSNLSSVNSIEKFKQLFVYAPGTTTISPASHTGDINTMLEPHIVFSTLNMRYKEVPKVNDINPVTSLPYVPTCPDGKAVSYCNGAPSCENIVDCNAVIKVDENTEINIWFDNSGSMDTTLTPLQTMQSTILKNCLLPVYNNDSALYDKKVRVIKMSEGGTEYVEAFVTCISQKRNFKRDPDTNVKLVINLSFADEADPNTNVLNNGYHTSLVPISTTERSTRYDRHITNAKANLAQAAADGYIIKGYQFRVATANVGLFAAFRELNEKTFVDNGGIYSSQYTLADQAANNIFLYDLDTVAGSTPKYYADKIIEALQALGIDVPVC